MELETREYTAQTGRIIKAAQSGRLRLVRAYGGTAAECLRTAPSRPIVPMVGLTFHCGFSDHALIRARLLAMDATIDDETFGADGVDLRITRNRPLWAALIMRPVCAVYSRVSSSMATVRGAG
ncbi:DUF1949 domain-containing protein [Komagataeibacter sp. FNDCR1]|nr:DUF1949 domain-containing protein [Komagataeibacter sp. FNDCR1]